MHRSFPLVLALGCALSVLVPGCARTPKDVCQDYVDALNGMVTRCELARPFVIAWPDGRFGCEHTARISNATAIGQDCIPWAESVPCEDLTFDAAGDPILDSSCSAGTFEAYPP